MTGFRKCALAAVCAIATVAAAQAQGTAPATTSVLRFGLTYASPTGDQTFTDPFDYEYTSEFDSALGASVSYEYRFSPRLGVEAGVSYVSSDLDLSVGDALTGETFATGSDSISMMPLTIGLNIYLAGGDPWSFYVAPELAYITYGNSDVTLSDEIGELATAEIELESEFTWGVKVGFDWAFNPSWALTARAEYIDAKAEVDDIFFDDGDGGFDVPEFNGQKLNVKPILVTVGLAYRF